MAMNIDGNTITTKIFIGNNLIINNHQIDPPHGFDATGLWNGGQIIESSSYKNLTESMYIDIGILLDEQEQCSLGGIFLPIPTYGADGNYYWSIGARTLRLTLTGIIPDGVYVGINSDTEYNGYSNSSVFRKKLNKLVAYGGLLSSNEIVPAVIQYRRKYIKEKLLDYTTETSFAKWTLTSYNFAFINGTRNVSYTLTLDISNNSSDVTDRSPLKDKIASRSLGDFR